VVVKEANLGRIDIVPEGNIKYLPVSIGRSEEVELFVSLYLVDEPIKTFLRILRYLDGIPALWVFSIVDIK
jgi:hypothetical protein